MTPTCQDAADRHAHAMDLPKRPQLWMHRTRAFWFGLIGLIALTALWCGSLSQGAHLYYTRAAPDQKTWAVGVGGGDFIYESTTERRALPPGFYTARQYYHGKPLTWWPEKTLRTMHLSGGGAGPADLLNVELPIWPLLPLWAIGWVLWMARKDRREAAYFRSVNRSGAE